MDGKGRWPGNVYVERLWRSLKQEEVYWHAYETVSEAKKGIADYLRYFNEERPHQGLDNRTPDDSALKNAGKTVQFSRTISSCRLERLETTRFPPRTTSIPGNQKIDLFCLASTTPMVNRNSCVGSSTVSDKQAATGPNFL